MDRGWVCDTDIEDDLVEELHCVAAEHQRHDMPINLASQSIDIDGLTVSRHLSMIIKKLPRAVDIARAAFGPVRRVSDVDVLLLILQGRHVKRVRQRGVYK